MVQDSGNEAALMADASLAFNEGTRQQHCTPLKKRVTFSTKHTGNTGNPAGCSAPVTENSLPATRMSYTLQRPSLRETRWPWHYTPWDGEAQDVIRRDTNVTQAAWAAELTRRDRQQTKDGGACAGTRHQLRHFLSATWPVLMAAPKLLGQAEDAFQDESC